MGKVKYKTSAQSEWNERTGTIKPHKYTIPFFHDLLKDSIPNGKNKKCIELGAIPGNYLAYFKKKFGYSITGLDFSEHSEVFSNTMKENGIKKYEFITADILTYSTKEKYDLVCSFGLIEHFDDIELVLQKHIDLLGEDGLLLITVPNFRYLQWLYHRVFDYKNLLIHNIDAMRSREIDSYLQGRGLKQIINQPYGAAEFWYEDQAKGRLSRTTRDYVTTVLNRRLKNVHDNKMTSPYLIYLYQK